MATGTNPETAPSMSALVSGIINDAQQLIRQELTLARREIQDEVTKAKEAALSMAVGAGLAALGGVLLALCIVAVLHEPVGLPWWASFLIVGGVITGVAVGLLLAGRMKASEVHVIPPQTAETMKENVEWIQNAPK
jgi:hypothetical protein